MAKFTLNAKQTLAAPLLAAGQLKKEVAKHVEVDPSTISEWMKEPAFQAAIAQEQEAMVQATRDRMRSLGSLAVGTLESVLLDSNALPKDRIRAAELVLTNFRTVNHGLNPYSWGETDPERIAEDEDLGGFTRVQLDAMLGELAVNPYSSKKP